MDSANGAPRQGDGHSSFFNQRGAANDAVRPSSTQDQSRPMNNDPEALTRMNDARKFEDEKQRIIASCFGRKDERGVPHQNYITHIQVYENSASPSDPPPVDAPESQRKSRVIIVAVKNSGRVMMHKARENDDTTYQIGKTWPLEELQMIETFSPSQARTDEERLRITRAGPLGFALTLGKPYFWRARSLLEKGHFILGLIKIYSKYTGSIPQLVGFEPRERDKIMSTAQIPPAAAQILRDQQPAPLQPQSRNSPQQQQRQQQPQAQPQLQPQQQRHQEVSDHTPTVGLSSANPALTDQQKTPSPLRYQSTAANDGKPPPMQRVPSDQTRQQPPTNFQLRGRPSEEFRAKQEPGLGQAPPQEPRIRIAAPLRSQLSRQALNDQQQAPRPMFVEQTRVPSRQGLVVKDAQGSVVDLSERTVAEPVPPPLQAPETAPLSFSTGRLWRPDGQNTTSAVGTIPNPALANLLNNLPTQTAPISTSLSGASQILPERRRPPLQDSASFRSEVEISATNNTATPDILPSEQISTSISSQQQPTQVTGARLPGTYTPSISTLPINTEKQTQVTSVSENQSKNLSLTIPGTRAVVDKPAVDKRGNTPPITPSETTGGDDRQVPSPLEDDVLKQEPKFRPGLGPMMGKKGEVANKFRKAASAASAFKPRAGGAGERLLKSKLSTEPEGITKVVPAPNTTRELQTNGAEPQIMEDVVGKDDLAAPVVIETISQPQSPSESQDQVVSPTDTAVSREQDNDMVDRPNDLTVQKHDRDSGIMKVKRRSNVYANALAAIDIDSTVMDGREVDYENVLAEFGWEKNLLQSKQIDAIQASIRREIGRLEAGSWLGHSDRKDDRVDLVGRMLDKAIGECDEMERLLTLYSVELGTLNDDIAYIEAQSQGLQVQTANQKLLSVELEKLTSTISIDSQQLEPLKQSALQDPQGLADIERSLLLLYQALQKISPSLLGHEERAISANYSDQTMSSMRALQENKDFYAQESQHFLLRLRKYAEPTFSMAFSKTKDAIGRPRTSTESSVRLEIGMHDLARNALWQYSPLMLFAKEVNPAIWQDILSAYQGQARAVYEDELRDNLTAWKKLARKYTGEEQDALFTSVQEKESDNSGGSARKLTVKRSQTLARTFRTGSVEKRLGLDKGQDSKLSPFECFSGALEETTPLIVTEQNFVVDFFHATSLDSADFVELVTTTQPSGRRGTNLSARKPIEPDRAMARKVSEVVEVIFAAWQGDIQNLVEWALSIDPFQGVGILCALERKQTELEDGNQEFIVRTIRKLQDRLMSSFSRFVDSQIRAIEDTKVKINKRRGVISFIKVFPNFSILVENMLPPADGAEKLDLRKMIDGAYQKISHAMFESLKTIAKEMPMGPIQGSGADPEDKEALNYHILLIENMYHFYTELEERGDAMLGQLRGRAMLEMSEHQELYVTAVIRRPLGKLLDFVEGAESSRSTSATAGHSRSAFKKVLGSYDSKEVRRGIDTLRKRIEKHFGEGDDHVISQKLISQILGECERRYQDILDRTLRLAGEKYEGSVEVEFGKGDIAQGFKR